MTQLSGWGRYPVHDSHLVRFDPRHMDQSAMIARGNGRSYGDSATGLVTTLDMRAQNRLLDFDPATGLLVAEAGVMLADIIDIFLPRGWFPAVTPGSKYVTLGGMVAADVHGKNHHKDGSIGRFIAWIDVLGADNQVRRCGRVDNPLLFEWTLGGMGLTGVILRVAMHLRRVETAWIAQELHVGHGLAHVMALFSQHDDADYSVAWLDLQQGHKDMRALLWCGAHASHDQLPAHLKNQPFVTKARTHHRLGFDWPPGAINRWSVGLFNRLYFWAGARRAGVRLVDYDRFFYPLDALDQWNRIYGRRGFVQYQFVLPLDQAQAGIEAVIDALHQVGAAPFLTVLKRMGASAGGLSFAMEGYTLAMDFSASPRILALLDRLDVIALHYGARFYLAKDARMSAQSLWASDKRVALFKSYRTEEALVPHFQSYQSARLSL